MTGTTVKLHGVEPGAPVVINGVWKLVWVGLALMLLGLYLILERAALLSWDIIKAVTPSWYGVKLLAGQVVSIIVAIAVFVALVFVTYIGVSYGAEPQKKKWTVNPAVAMFVEQDTYKAAEEADVHRKARAVVAPLALVPGQLN